MDPLTLLLGTAIGLVMGITGAGGGVLAVPTLLYGLHLSMQQAAPIALVAVAVAATLGTVEGLRRGVVRYRAAGVIAVAAWPLSAAGIALAHRLPDLALRGLFVAILAVVGWRALTRGVHDESVPHPLPLVDLDPATGRFVWTGRAWAGFGAAGAVTGFLSGLLGVGGGFVLVPMLNRFTLLSVASVVGTSLMVVALVSVFGALASVAQGVGPPWVLTLWYTAALSVGMVCGRAVERRLHESLIRRSFALLVLGVAAAMALDVAWRLLAR